VKKENIIKEIIRNKTFIIGFVIFTSIVIVAVFAGKIAPFYYDEMNISDALTAPGDKYMFGTDQYGRDIFSIILKLFSP